MSFCGTAAEASDEVASDEALDDGSLDVMSDELASEDMDIDDIESDDIMSDDIDMSALEDDDISELIALIGISDALELISIELEAMSLDIDALDELSCATAAPATMIASTPVDPASTDRKSLSFIHTLPVKARGARAGRG